MMLLLFLFWSTVLCTCPPSFVALCRLCGPFVAFADVVMMQREGIVTPCNVAKGKKKNLVSKNDSLFHPLFFFFFNGAMTLSFFAVVLSHFVEALLTTMLVVFRAQPLPRCPLSPTLPFFPPHLRFVFSHKNEWFLISCTQLFHLCILLRRLCAACVCPPVVLLLKLCVCAETAHNLTSGMSNLSSRL